MSLPDPYADWLRTLCGGPLPQERRATCDDCVMCAPDVVGGNEFAPSSKCCTYVPRLPNFMMGRILNDTSLEEGRQTVLARLGMGIGVSPLGLEVSAADQAAYDAIVSNDAFGRSAALRCPHYLDDGRCGVWRNRNGVCSTWFCKHESGALSQTFWETVQLMFTELERVVGYWVARRVRWPEGVDDVFESDKQLFALDWGPHADDAAGFYSACAAEFAKLDWRRVRQIGDANFDRLCAAVQSAYAVIKGPLPKRLCAAGDLEVFPRADGQVDVLAYSATDPMTLSGALFDDLESFDGRRVLDVMADLKARGVEIDLDLVAQLRAFEVLKPRQGD